MHHTEIDSPIGPLTVVRDDDAVTGLYFPGHWTRPDATRWGRRDDGGFDEVREQLGAYFAGARTTFDVPLRLDGTVRQRELWALLLAVPYGTTTTYAALSAALGGTHPRAVGGFVGRNPVSILVPCHRVLGSSGSLTGYAGGLERKQHLLELEGARERTG